ncbi:MAG TPA: class I SAM-dependent methyltransferase [Candidatus Hydrogenedentes bacterium]|nr:class I SAM-dependent methyltransferase [Candidatus Hydrogenedentota bacterium]
MPIVRRWRKPLESARRIVEVGANQCGFARFAKKGVIVVDLDFEHLRAARVAQPALPVQADATALPFASDSVDLCLCVDTLEHIPERAREAVLEEIARIRCDFGRGVVTFPSGTGALRAESLVRQAYARHAGQSLTWLEEHAREGLPDPDRVTRRLARAARVRVRRSSNAALPVWQWMWRVLVCGWPGRGNAFFQALVRLATPLLTRVHWGACYRTMIWVDPNGHPAEREETMYRVIKAPPRVSWGAWRETYELVTSLKDIDDVKRVIVDFYRGRNATFALESGDTLVFLRGTVFWSVVSFRSERMMRQTIVCDIQQEEHATVVRLNYKVYTSLYLHVAENYLLRDVKALDAELDAMSVSLGMSEPQ